MKLTIGIITLFPEMLQALNYGITGRAQEKGLLTLHTWNPRNYSTLPHQRVDDRPYGGGPGMVMCYEPLAKTITAAKQQLGPESRVIHLSPQGKPLTQEHLQQTVESPHPLILLASRYEGIDERLLEHHIDEEWSIGDYVLTGGELPAMVIIDGLTRLLPEALGDEQSAVQDSFVNGLLDHPHYTRPEQIDGFEVPKVLLSGDHSEIIRWRMQESLYRTWQKRPDLLKRRTLSASEQALLEKLKRG